MILTADVSVPVSVAGQPDCQALGFPHTDLSFDTVSAADGRSLHLCQNLLTCKQRTHEVLSVYNSDIFLNCHGTKINLLSTLQFLGRHFSFSCHKTMKEIYKT